METSYTVLRARKQTAQQLKIVAAITGETVIDVLERLAATEYERVYIIKAGVVVQAGTEAPHAAREEGTS